MAPASDTKAAQQIEWRHCQTTTVNTGTSRLPQLSKKQREPQDKLAPMLTPRGHSENIYFIFEVQLTHLTIFDHIK